MEGFKTWQCADCGKRGVGDMEQLALHWKGCDAYQSKKEEWSNPTWLPCPFCGSIWNIKYTTHGEWIDGYSVYCSSCQAEGPLRETKQKAQAAWNTRGWNHETN